MRQDGSSAPVGVAVIGTGAIAAIHAAAIAETDGLELVAIGSRTRSGAQAFIDGRRGEWGDGTVSSATLDDILQDDRIALVAVATPTGTHIDIGTQVLESGRHLMLEKPLDVDLRRTLDFARVAARAEASGLIAAAVSQHRFDPDALVVHEAVTAGRLGMLTSGVASIGWWRSQEYYDRESWRGTWSQDGGGALMNQGVHTLDLLQWLMGRPVRVSASSRTLAHERIEVEDTVAALLEFESGALATVHATTSAFPGLASRLQVMGTLGSAIIEHDALSYLHIADGSDVGDMGLHGAGNQVTPPDHDDNRDATTMPDGHARQYAEVAEAIHEGRRTRVSIGDAVDTLLTIHAIYRSATIGRPVELTELIEQPRHTPYRVGQHTTG